MQIVTRAGLDWSINSPAICVCSGEPIIANCHFYVYAQTQKQLKIKHPQLTILTKEDEFETRIHKYKATSNLIDIALSFVPDVLNIEGYSFGSVSSSALQMAENGGIMRLRLIEKGISFNEHSPGSIKKNATGKGNAKKDAMYAAWLENDGFDLLSLFQTTNHGANPLSDIVDSFFIMRM